jgi:hypothetical protein
MFPFILFFLIAVPILLLLRLFVFLLPASPNLSSSHSRSSITCNPLHVTYWLHRVGVNRTGPLFVIYRSLPVKLMASSVTRNMSGERPFAEIIVGFSEQLHLSSSSLETSSRQVCGKAEGSQFKLLVLFCFYFILLSLSPLFILFFVFSACPCL